MGRLWYACNIMLVLINIQFWWFVMCMTLKYLFFKIALFNYVKNSKRNTSFVVLFSNFLLYQCSFQDGVLVTSSDYVNASPDPLRNCAENLVNEMNSKHMEDVHRFCIVYVDLGFKVCIQKFNYFYGINYILRTIKNKKKLCF